MASRIVHAKLHVNTFIQKACTLLDQGELVVIPTETVYGLAADSTNTDAVLSIYELKQRPRFNPLIAHVSSLEMALRFVSPHARLLDFLEYFWIRSPSPLTVVLPLKEPSSSLSPPNHISPLVTSGLKTLAIRMPRHPVALELIRIFNKPLAAPSANPSQYISPTTAFMVKEGFKGRCPFILDGGPSEMGLESTIIDLSLYETTGEIFLLRPGSCLIEPLERFLKQKIIKEDPGLTSTLPLKSPGQLKKHYSPRKPLSININTPKETDYWLTFGPLPQNTEYHPFQRSLSERGSLKEAASNLFFYLFEADNDLHTTSIAVFPLPKENLGEAILDRLIRAQTP